jgi:hypothetical protein
MKKELKSELDALAEEAKREGETLKAKRIVAWAKANQASAIWKDMDAKGAWNDKAAAEKYRRLLANQLVRVYVKIVPPNTEPVRAYVHLASDASGYRRTDDVLGHPAMRAEVLNTALAKVSAMKTSFSYLPELNSFFVRLDAMIADYRVELMSAKKTG